MLEEGKINTDEAEELLDSIEKKVETGKPPTKIQGKKLKIRVESEDGEKVNINIPLSLGKFLMRFIPPQQVGRLAGAGVDLEAILGHIDELENMDEDIVNVESEDGEKVRIYIE